MHARIQAARENESGFTLVELLIVIVILGVLAGIVVFSVSGITDRGDKVACDANLTSVRVAAEAYRAQATDSKYALSVTALSPKFLQSVPKTVAQDPTKGVTYASAAGATPTYQKGSACTP